MDKSKTKKFLTEWNDLFQMGYSDDQIEKDSQLLSKMTPQETEENRSRQVKCHYASLIQYELTKLTEEQLYKVFVLVKNTTDELTKPVRPPKRSLNRALLNPTKKTEGEPATNIRAIGNVLKKQLVEMGLNEGYGVISMFGQTSFLNYTSVAEYICFCIPDQIDMMAEIAPSTNQGNIIFNLSTSVVGGDGVKTEIFFNLDTLVKKINSIVKQYKN